MHPNRLAISATAAIIFLSVISVSVSATELPPCPPLNLPVKAPLFVQQESTPTEQTYYELVTFNLTPGLLKPQLESLLKEHWQIQNFIWRAAHGHYWPTHYRMQAASWDELLEMLITPYQLRIALHANHTAVIDYLPEQGGVK
ncbi:hypothetical protein [Aliidiomarina sp.]|uniref:hypothetical protein n=1 Tax=Aliidiomarina sp. TaxID=1872439 RepID=UPI003A4D74F6